MDQTSDTPITRTAGPERHETSSGLVLYTHADDTVHQLNPMSTLIYELADGRTAAAIARSVATVFDLDTAVATSRVRQGVRDLAQRGLVT